MMQDPIADLLTRIRNGQASGKVSVTMPSSKLKVALANLLLKEGYVSSVAENGEVKKVLEIGLKYYEGAPVIEMIKRVSRPGLVEGYSLTLIDNDQACITSWSSYLQEKQRTTTYHEWFRYCCNFNF